MKAGPSKRTFDAAALKQGFPGLVDPRLHYLDNAAATQMPEVVLNALRRFEVEAREPAAANLVRTFGFETSARKSARDATAATTRFRPPPRLSR